MAFPSRVAILLRVLKSIDRVARSRLCVAVMLTSCSVLTVAALLDHARAGLTSGPAPSELVLKASQVGAGYRLQQRPDGRGVRGFVTLDMCGFTFRSESLRTKRLQVDYVHPGHAVEVSNEVVTYRGTGAQLALREVAFAASHCPRGLVSSSIQGMGPVTYRVAQIEDRRLLKEHVALRVHLSGTADGRPFAMSIIAVYQIRTSVLSGVYATGEEGVTLADKLRVGLRAAAASATNLRRM
jgi:hypothetical protein